MAYLSYHWWIFFVGGGQEGAPKNIQTEKLNPPQPYGHWSLPHNKYPVPFNKNTFGAQIVISTI